MQETTHSAILVHGQRYTLMRESEMTAPIVFKKDKPVPVTGEVKAYLEATAHWTDAVGDRNRPTEMRRRCLFEFRPIELTEE